MKCHLRMPLYACRASLMSPASLQMRVMSRYVTWLALFLDAPHTCAHGCPAQQLDECWCIADSSGQEEKHVMLCECLGRMREEERAGHTMVRKTARASCASPPEPSALMSAFNNAVSTLSPLLLMSCGVHWHIPL